MYDALWELEKAAITERRGEAAWEELLDETRANLDQLQPLYLQAEEMYEKGKIVELLEAFKIKTFDNPMFSGQLDNAQDVKILKNTFGKKALMEWDGDMTTKYAQIEVEKQYLI